MVCMNSGQLAVPVGDLHAIIDETDGFLLTYRWHLHRSGRNRYACRTVRVGRKTAHVYMHHYLLPKLPRGIDVDHADGDGLNNRRGNLRYLLHGENVSQGFTRRQRRRRLD